MGQEVKLYGTWMSPYSGRVELALKIKGVEYELIEEDLKNKSPELLRYNPVHKKIPVLVHNGNPIAESLVILEYIDDTWPNNPLLPKHPYDRAQVRFWAKFIDEKIYPSAVRSIMGKDEEEKGKAIEEVGEQLKLVDNELKGLDFFGGDTIGYLDILLVYLVRVLDIGKEVTGVELINGEKFQVLQKWSEKVLDLEVVKKCLPPIDKLLAHFRARFEAATAASK